MDQMCKSISDVKNYLLGKIEWYKADKDYNNSTVITELEHMLEMCNRGIEENKDELTIYILLVNKDDGWQLHTATGYVTLQEAKNAKEVILNHHSNYAVSIFKHVEG